MMDHQPILYYIENVTARTMCVYVTHQVVAKPSKSLESLRCTIYIMYRTDVHGYKEILSRKEEKLSRCKKKA